MWERARTVGGSSWLQFFANGVLRTSLALVLLAGCATTTVVVPSQPPWLSAPRGDVSLERRHVLFVAGFGSELISGYFSDNAEVCRALGAETSMITPPSGGGFDADLELIEQELAFRRGVPIVLFGHSKGGADVLLSALRHPERVLSGEIEAVIVVQGAVGGSPLADLVGWIPGVGNGMKDLTTSRARTIFGSALADLDARLTPEERARFFSRVFYVRSARQAKPVAAELGLTELILRAHGPNDGLLAQSDMRLARGEDLGVIDSDHVSLTVSNFLSVSTADERKAFTLALFQEIARRGALQTNLAP